MKFLFKSVLFIGLFFVGFNMYEQYKHDEKADSFACHNAQYKQAIANVGVLYGSTAETRHAEDLVNLECN